MKHIKVTLIAIMVSGLLVAVGCGKKEAATSKAPESKQSTVKEITKKTDYLANPAAALGKAYDVTASATLQSIRVALEAYRAEQGTYPQIPDDDLAALENTMGGHLPQGIKIGSALPGALTGYRGTATTYAVTAMGRDSKHFYHLKSDTSVLGPDSSPSIDD